MYGLILEGIADAIRRKFGDDVWETVRRKAGIPHHSFIVHKTYSETVVPRLVKATAEVTERGLDELMELCGIAFVNYVGKYGYDRIMRVLGRNLRDFINGLDNLHEYLRFSYSKMKPPSFFCENETRHGLTLHYRSKRRGFVYYVMGQITQVAMVFYNTPVEIELVSEEETLDMTHVVMKLHFDNTAYKDPLEEEEENSSELRIRSQMFFEVFPFHIVFNRAMMIRSIGTGLVAIMPHLLEQCVDEMFSLVRPLVEFTVDNVMMHTNNVFELMSVDPVRKGTAGADQSMESEADDDDPDDKMRRLRLKGQMIYMDEWEAIMFLGTPVMENLDKMFETGLFINDLSMHDSSRDLVLAGTQQQAELKMALDQEQQKSRKLEESMRKLDIEMKRTEALLYQMIPKVVADRLRNGEPAINTCQVFDNVSILFSDVVGFTKICSQITPMQVVAMLNALYTRFDRLSEVHKVYKVETIGDAYMVVSGAPIVTKYHALYLCDMALDMQQACKSIKDPSESDSNVQIRIGIHSGPVVAGVVGVKMPRYCFFGDTVITGNMMESQGAAGYIHISEMAKAEVVGYPYDIQDAGSIEASTGVVIATFWLMGKSSEARTSGPVAGTVDESANLDGMVSAYSIDDIDDIDTTHLYQPIHEGKF